MGGGGAVGMWVVHGGHLCAHRQHGARQWHIGGGVA